MSFMPCPQPNTFLLDATSQNEIESEIHIHTYFIQVNTLQLQSVIDHT